MDRAYFDHLRQFVNDDLWARVGRPFETQTSGWAFSYQVLAGSYVSVYARVAPVRRSIFDQAKEDSDGQA